MTTTTIPTSPGALTLLQIVQSATKRIGLQTPSSAIASTDPTILQLVALCEEEGQEQATSMQWESLQYEAQFTTVALENQGALKTIAPGFDYVLNNAMWNRTLRRPVYGPNTPQEWQQSKAMQLNGPWNSYRIRGDAIYFYPAPPAGQQIDFEYYSKNWVYPVTGITSPIWTADSDQPLVNDQLMILGLVWRWREAKGLDFSGDFQKYEKRKADAFARDASRPVLNMGGGNYEINPVVLVPRGSWGK